MRGRRIVGLLLPHRSPFPPIAHRCPSSADEAVRQLSALVIPSSSGSLSAPASADERRSFQNRLGHRCLPQDFIPRSHLQKPSSHPRDLLPIRSVSASSYCHCASAQSSAAGGVLLGLRRFSRNVSAKRTDRCCWSCEYETSTGNGLFCPSCKAIQPLDPTIDFFLIFSLDRSFKVDTKELEQSYKSLQKRLHPDLAGSKSEREREYSAEQSAHVIQAYYLLLRPLSRARYLLSLHGIEVEEEGTIDDPELLMEIMEIRESIDDISDATELKDAEAANRDKILNCEKELESCFRDGDFTRATSWTQRLAYYIKVGEEILRKL